MRGTRRGRKSTDRPLRQAIEAQPDLGQISPSRQMCAGPDRPKGESWATGRAPEQSENGTERAITRPRASRAAKSHSEANRWRHSRVTRTKVTVRSGMVGRLAAKRRTTRGPRFSTRQSSSVKSGRRWRLVLGNAASQQCGDTAAVIPLRNPSRCRARWVSSAPSR